MDIEQIREKFDELRQEILLSKIAIRNLSRNKMMSKSKELEDLLFKDGE